ncbi:hypothetical protein SEPCBS119000_003626 [Sporothrix epigloea]|uniref:Uncharacterized protein n=1 Tax=Sporothrix epigloea TaxID=1892477 RepID=A0ABP0DMN4_9PEZI
MSQTQLPLEGLQKGCHDDSAITADIHDGLTLDTAHPTEQPKIPSAVIALGGHRKLKSTADKPCAVPSPQRPLPSPPPSSSSSSASPTQPNHKAFYQITRLEPAEMERRISLGMCTYCAEDGHSRHMCAQGRLMRKVTKSQLDERLKRCVCPICGDPDRDQHCKQTCPRRVQAQAILNAKQNENRKKKGLPPLGEVETSKTDGKQAVQYETVVVRLPTFILKKSLKEALDEVDQHDHSKGNGKQSCKKAEFKRESWRKKAAETAPVADKNLLPALGSNRPSRPAAVKVLQPSLLDAEISEVVWGNVSLRPRRLTALQQPAGHEEETVHAGQITHSAVHSDGLGSIDGHRESTPRHADPVVCEEEDLIDLDG